MNLRSGRNRLFTAAIACLIISALPAQEKENPGNSGIQECTSCHENHKRSYEMWAASGHSKSLSRVLNNSQATPDCYACHSDEGFKAKQAGKKADLALKETFSPVTCLTCHKPHDSKNPHHLVMDAEDLCTSCHQQRSVLQGKGARGIDEMRSFHSAVDCISCHMSEGNHLMKLIRPDDPDLAESRVDTCTACHRDNNRKARASQIRQWQADYKENMDRLQADLKAIGEALKEKPNLLNEKAKATLNDVQFNLRMLERDRSRGVHNHDFALEIMSRADKALIPVKSRLGSK